MKLIIVGTNRPGSRSAEVGQIISDFYSRCQEPHHTINLADYPFEELRGAQYGNPPDWMRPLVEKINESSGLHFVVPEYNGSFPGILKYFIDFWEYPKSFEHRPVCFVGLGGRFGGLRPVEHLQGVFGYRNAFVFPDRVFLMNIFKTLQDGVLVDEEASKLLEKQVTDFIRFSKAVKDCGLFQ